MARRPVPIHLRDTAFPFLESAFRSANPFVRAWALSALHSWRDEADFATLYDQWRAELATIPKPSIQARIRALDAQ